MSSPTELEASLPPTPARLIERFREAFGAEPRLYRAPGRVNLIGEHTDYNDGFVLPAAIDLAAWIAAAPRPDRVLRVVATDLDARAELPLDDPDPRPAGDWSDYVRGVAIELRRTLELLKAAEVGVDRRRQRVFIVADHAIAPRCRAIRSPPARR